MSASLACPPTPCATCPYRRDTPPGIWHASEYRKLPDFDPDARTPSYAVFHCHQENLTGKATLCRGWVAVHGFRSIAVRLAEVRGLISVAEVERPCPVPLYASGAEACAAGLKGVRRPSAKARQKINKMAASGKFKS